VGWIESEIDTLNAARAAGMSDDEIRDLVTWLEAARKGLRPDFTDGFGPGKDC
jgi:prophage regulatory protein